MRFVRQTTHFCTSADGVRLTFEMHGSLDAWVADLEAVVDAAGLEWFSLLGLSNGGAG